MKVSTEPVKNGQMTLKIEMEGTEVDRYLERAYNRLVRKVSIPGFRKGKAPRAILEQHIGKETLLREAFEDLIPEAYKEATQNIEIDAIASPQFEIIQTEPLVLKAVIPLRPTVKIGDYKQIRIDPKPVEVGEDDVNAVMEQLRLQQAVLLPVDRPVQFGDVVTIDVEGERQGESFPIRKNLVYEVIQGARLPLPGFAEKLEGMRKGEERHFVLSYPEDYEMRKLAGKEHIFKVTVTEIKEKRLPPVNDEFAKKFGSQDLASFRELVFADLKARAEERTRMELEQQVVNSAIEISEVEYPPILVDREIERLLNEESRHFHQGIKGLENYLKSVDRTLDEHLEELRPIASRRVARSLVLAKIAEEENIEVGEAEIDEEVEKILKDAGKQTKELSKLLDLAQTRESIKQFIIARKTVERLVQIATQKS